MGLAASTTTSEYPEGFTRGRVSDTWTKSKAEPDYQFDEVQGIHEDKWIPTMCGTCYSHCGIRAHVVDGVVVKIEGNPAVPNGRGRICAKGLAQVQTLYDPYRLTVPLLRTNPEKGLDADPKWKEISWEEALEIYAQKL